MDQITRAPILAAVTAILLLVPVIWMLMDNTPPYSYTKIDIAPVPAVSGEDIYITFHVESHRNSCGAGLVYREFKEASGKLHVYDPILRSRAPILQDGKFTRIAELPFNLAPGQVMYRGNGCYFCNPLQRWLRWPICVPTPEVPFTVVSHKP